LGGNHACLGARELLTLMEYAEAGPDVKRRSRKNHPVENRVGL